MHKRLLDQRLGQGDPVERSWLGLETLTRVELTSEYPASPFESALRPGSGPGWRAGEPGAQTIRLYFAEPQRVSRVRLVFEEEEHNRTQEFALAYSADQGKSYRELVRQQYNFSPPTTTREVEEYTFALDHVTGLELRIVPAISGGAVCASLRELRIA